MSLDPTARSSNLKDSIKKYFVDNIYTTEGIEIGFDKSMARPKIQGQPVEVEKWVVVNSGYIDPMGTLSEHQIDVICCSRKDNEGYKLAQLRDTVMGYLTDNTQTDTMRRIPFYRSYASQAWTLLGALLVTEIIESPRNDAEDETKFIILTTTLRWAAKI